MLMILIKSAYFILDFCQKLKHIYIAIYIEDVTLDEGTIYYDIRFTAFAHSAYFGSRHFSF